jgi:hypothetical protein
VLNKLRYWMVNELPVEVCEFVFSNRKLTLTDFKDFFFDELQFLNTCQTMEKNYAMNTAAKKGYLSTIKYYYHKNVEYYLMNDSSKSKYYLDNPLKEALCKFLKHYARDEDEYYIWNNKTSGLAASNGHLEVLKYMYKYKCPMSESVIDSATKDGYMDCVRWAIKNGLTFSSEAYKNCALNDHYYSLEYLYEHKKQSHDQSWTDPNIMCNVINSSFYPLDTVKFLHKNGCRLTSDLCTCAAESCEIDVLKYLHTNGCPWDESTCSGAAWGGDIECLKYAHLNKCKWNSETCHLAAGHGHLDCLMYAHKHGCPIGNSAERASRENHLECLKYAHENGSPLTEKCCQSAANIFGNHLECLKYLFAHNCPRSHWACSMTGVKDDIETLKYVHENGCELNANLLWYVMKYNSIKCLRYANKHNIPCTSHNAERAAEHDSYECFRYICEQYCWCDKEHKGQICPKIEINRVKCLQAAKKHNSKKIIYYLDPTPVFNVTDYEQYL